MKAMVLRKFGLVEDAPLEWTDVPDPEPGPGEVRIRVDTCGVCRTDLHVIEGELEERKLPVIPGHQIVGVVDQVGEGRKRFKEGDRIGVAWLRYTCGACVFCENGQENLCESSGYTGWTADGGYAEYAVVPEDFAYALPEGFSDTQVAPLLCAGIIGYRALMRTGIQRGDTIALYGFGSSAHVVLQIALHWDCSVYVVTRGEQHCRFAERLGAKWAGTDAATLPVQVDRAIIFAPAGELVPPALEGLRKGGTLALAGIYMSDIPSMDYERYVFYERDIHSVTANTREDGRGLLKVAAEIPVRTHVTTYPMHEANRALQDLKADRIDGSAVLVRE